MFESTEEAAAYLSGLIDGEGSVRSDTYNSSHSGSIVVWNTDADLLDACEEAMRLLGASPKRYSRATTGISRKQGYYTRVGTRSDIEALAVHLRLRVTSKREALERCLKHYQNSTKTPSSAWPREELTAFLQDHTQRQAAARFGVSQSTIERWYRAAR